MASEGDTKILGFIGLGSMGGPMAANIARAGVPLLVWNRSPEKTIVVEAVGGTVSADCDEVFERSWAIILMLSDEIAVDRVLDRDGPLFASRVSGKTIVHMGTTSPSYSADLQAEIIAAGGRYVEAPVSGSKKPAEAGELVAMVAGDRGAVADVLPILQPMCRKVVVCGSVPCALITKLAVNIFLLTTVTGLAESLHFAARQGLDLEQIVDILDSSQMASSISRLKAAKIKERDFAVQAAIADVTKNARLIADAAQEAGIALPTLEMSKLLFEETLRLGHGAEDMVAVIRALESGSIRPRAEGL